MEIQGSTIQFDYFWDDSYKYLDYEIEPFNNPNDVATWLSLGYKCNFTGAMCDMRYRQPIWNTKFIDYFSILGWKNVCTSYYRMDTCTILPLHKDTYKKYVEIYKLQENVKSIRRAIVFLEDWYSGHYIEVNNRGYTNWSKGFCVVWQYDELHMAANIGMAPRYTLQITGHI